jgi:hypothetical protein
MQNLAGTKRVHLAASLLFIAGLVFHYPVRAAEPPAEGEDSATADQERESPIEALLADGEHCISLNRIDRTTVVDDRSILFYMRGGDIYLNRLPHRCPGLRWEETFMYRTSIGRLCDLDIITVLNNIGFGYSPGASCGLGMFFPISEATADQLRSRD